MFFILKIKGTKTIPDFVQIRNADMTLQAYFRLSQQDIGLKKNNLEQYAEPIMRLLKEMPFGKIYKFNPDE